MDLRKDFPRSMRATAGGYAHLARMIDKCRAVLAGTQGEYIYPCPLDRRLLDFVGITSDQFTAAVRSHQSDEGVVAWFREVATPRSTGELEEWNKTLLAERFRHDRDAVDSSRTDIAAWADLQDLEEGRAVPRR
jgi:hypothetical protein